MKPDADKPSLDLKNIELRVKDHWKNQNISKIIQDQVKDSSSMSFIEGPPTLNGEPHIGHIRGRIIKDLWYRFRTLQKYNVTFRGGWDTQGLPVELQAEKELGLKGSKAENLKKIGEEKLVEECKKLIHGYYKKWEESDQLLGMSLDQSKAYWTYRDEYIEREWKFLENAWNKKILEEGEAVVAYCPNCQTSLSHAEVAQGYEKVEDPSLYFKVKLVDEDVYMIVWTTMPFTLVTDLMTGVSPDELYCYVKVENETWIVSKERLSELFSILKIDDYVILKEIKGSFFDGKKYEHPLAQKYIPELYKFVLDNNAHIVIADDFVEVSTGTGIVHLSPANGEIDYEASKTRNIPLFSPIDNQVKFTEDAGRFKDLYVRDANDLVYELLEQENALVKVGRLTHDYPLCWRSGHRLIWIVRREYFYRVDKLDNLAVDAAHSVEYYYESPRNRFIEIVKEKKPWCVSRERVWGTPLPIWRCEKCDHKTGLFSRKAIIDRAIDLPDGENFELHKPWIDRIIIKCDQCGGSSNRENFVLDTWHNSGTAPYASLSDEEYSEIIPATFLTEGVDQTRGWAYTLLISNVILNNKAQSPFDAFLFQGHILDDKGNKMSKRLGNIVEGTSTLQNNSVDVLRFYLTRKSSPIDSLNFDLDELKARPYQVISTLYHIHSYLKQNSNYDSFNPNSNTIEWSENNNLLLPQDYWLLTKLQNVIEITTTSFEQAKYNDAAVSMERFIIDILSQSYLPMIRTEIWNEESETLNRRLAIYSVLNYVLKTIDIILHPICPFLTEFLYIENFGNLSIHTDKWPEILENFNNSELDSEFSNIISLLSLSNSARNKSKLKRRWPLRSAKLFVDEKNLSRFDKYESLLKEQLNVENIELVNSLKNLPIDITLKIKKDSLYKKFKNHSTDLQNLMKQKNPYDIYEELLKEESVVFKISDVSYELKFADIDFVFTDHENFASSFKRNVGICLSSDRDENLIVEGLVRDIARRIQNLRKDKGLDPNDLIEKSHISGISHNHHAIFSTKLDLLSHLTRSKNIVIHESEDSNIEWTEFKIDGNPIQIAIEK